MNEDDEPTVPTIVNSSSSITRENEHVVPSADSVWPPQSSSQPAPATGSSVTSKFYYQWVDCLM